MNQTYIYFNLKPSTPTFAAKNWWDVFPIYICEAESLIEADKLFEQHNNKKPNSPITVMWGTQAIDQLILYSKIEKAGLIEEIANFKDQVKALHNKIDKQQSNNIDYTI